MKNTRWQFTDKYGGCEIFNNKDYLMKNISKKQWSQVKNFEIN